MNALDHARPALPAASPGPKPRRRWLRRLRWPALVLALCGAGLAVNWWLLVGRWLEAADSAYVQGDIAGLAPRIEGHVGAILVADHQRVAAGEALIQLDQGLWRAR